MPHGPKQAGIAKLRIGQHAGDGEAAGAHLPEQGERLAPLRLQPDTPGKPRPIAGGVGQPRLGHIERGPQQVGAQPGPQRRGDRHLAIGDFPHGPTVLAGHPDRGRPWLGETRASEDHQPFAFGQHRPQAAPDAVGTPRRIGDEVLERLIAPGIGPPRQHRFHRLARAVAEQPLDVPAQRQLLCAMAEARLEGLEPSHQATQLPHRAAVVHYRAGYRIRRKSTMSSN